MSEQLTEHKWRYGYTKFQRLVIALAYVQRHLPGLVSVARGKGPNCLDARARLVNILDDMISGDAMPLDSAFTVASCEAFARMDLQSVIPASLYIAWMTFPAGCKADLKARARTLAEKHFPGNRKLYAGYLA